MPLQRKRVLRHLPLVAEELGRDPDARREEEKQDDEDEQQPRADQTAQAAVSDQQQT
jgi:hypothetical protein